MSATLSVVIPAYNEAVRLGNSIRAVVAYMREHAPDGEVIVVDDGSSDQTGNLHARPLQTLPETSAPQSSVTNQISGKDEPSGLDCSPRAVTSRSSQMPTSPRR